MNNLKDFKKRHNFTSLSSKLGFYLSSGQTNVCPKCGRKSFSIRNEETYKCFYPECELNKSGDIFNFVQALGLASNISEAMRLLGITPNNTSGSSTRHSLLTEVFQLYKQEYINNPIGNNYLLSRGYSLPKDIEIGLAPKQDNFLSLHLTNKTTSLQKEGLIKSNGLDYFTNSIVFPIRNIEGRLQHFHSRIIEDKTITINSDEPEPEKLRWVASKGTDTSDSNVNYLWNGYKEKHSKALFLTEGISDGLSLVSWGLPTISTLSIQADLKRLLLPFDNLQELHCIFDNDRMSINGGKYSYTYKSWEFILPKLIDFKLAKPHISIYCLMPPDTVSIKDLNNWYEQVSFQEFQTYYQTHTKNLTDFVFDLYKDRDDKQLLLLKLASIDKGFKAKLEVHVQQSYSSWIDYLVAIDLINYEYIY